MRTRKGSIFGSSLFISLVSLSYKKKISLAMSDRPSDFRLPELKDVVIAVKDVAAEWYELGLQLGLPDATLASIAAHPDIEGRGRMMLSKWLQYDTKASWEKLATALNKIGKNVIAANIRREFVSSVEQQSVEQEAERRTYMCLNFPNLSNVELPSFVVSCEGAGTPDYYS